MALFTPTVDDAEVVVGVNVVVAAVVSALVDVADVVV